MTRAGLACNKPSNGSLVSTSVLPVFQHFRYGLCWLPSPCDRLSRPPTTTKPPPRPVPSADDAPALLPRWLHGSEGDTGRFPRSSQSRSTSEASSSTPAASPRLRRRSSPWPPGRLSHRDQKFPATAQRSRVRTAASPYPPDLSWWAVKGRQTLISRVHLLVSLTGPASSGSADTSRRRAAATLTSISWIRLPSASPSRCDGQATKVSHLHPTSDASWRTWSSAQSSPTNSMDDLLLGSVWMNPVRAQGHPAAT